ncbi:MAG TPA: hypothetical protein ENJ60_09705 [Aeromonadales bacterium]|nr:hypothetical protein [Aeromonadales bacterium]
MSESNNHAGKRIKMLTGVIAIVGCDGTGKSTLSANILNHLQQIGPARRHYLGLVSGETGDKIKSLPFVGVRLERYLAKKASRAQDMKKTLPSTWTSLVMFFLSYYRAIQLLRVRRFSKKGTWVISDRYPQAEIPGFHYDGPGLTSTRTNSWFVRKLAAREQKLYNWMANYQPELIIRLDIDADTAYSRKPDHDMQELKDKIAVMTQLNYNGAPILDLDATKPFKEVLATAIAGIRKCQKYPDHQA